MIDVLRAEWIKLHTTTVTWVLAIIAVAFPLVVTALTASFESSPETISDFDVAELVTGVSIVSSMLLGVIAAIAITNEFGHGTIRPTFAAVPDRMRVLVAKPIVMTALTATLMVIILVATWLVGRGILDARADERVSDTGAVLPAFIGSVVLAVGLTLLGYGLGLLIRNSAATTSVLLLWPLVAEAFVLGLIVRALGDETSKWLPYFTGFNVALPDPDELAFGRVAGALYFGAWVVGIAAIGVYTTMRRDA